MAKISSKTPAAPAPAPTPAAPAPAPTFDPAAYQAFLAWQASQGAAPTPAAPAPAPTPAAPAPAPAPTPAPTVVDSDTGEVDLSGFRVGLSGNLILYLSGAVPGLTPDMLPTAEVSVTIGGKPLFRKRFAPRRFANDKKNLGWNLNCAAPYPQ
jgi:hypothetical protein